MLSCRTNYWTDNISTQLCEAGSSTSLRDNGSITQNAWLANSTDSAASETEISVWDGERKLRTRWKKREREITPNLSSGAYSDLYPRASLLGGTKRPKNRSYRANKGKTGKKSPGRSSKSTCAECAVDCTHLSNIATTTTKQNLWIFRGSSREKEENSNVNRFFVAISCGYSQTSDTEYRRKQKRKKTKEKKNYTQLRRHSESTQREK